MLKKSDNMFFKQQRFLTSQLPGLVLGLFCFVIVFQICTAVVTVCQLLWKTGVDQLSMFVRTMFALVTSTYILGSASYGENSKHAALRTGYKYRTLYLASILAGVCATLVFFAIIIVHKHYDVPYLSSTYDPNLPVAVVGAGASGLAAAWLLSLGGRNVTIFEASDVFGGHSQTYPAKGPAGSEQQDVDIGFIFNGNHYEQYKMYAKHFGHELVSTQLNTSSTWRGRYWDNAEEILQPDAHLNLEIDRFLALMEKPESTVRLLMPFGLWLKLNGFSEEFVNRCIRPLLNVLLVTKVGLDKISAQAALNSFKRHEGFTHLRREHAEAKLQRSKRGSHHLWEQVLKDMMLTGNVQMRMNASISSVMREGDHWSVSQSNGSTFAGFGDIILAIPAFEADRLLSWQPLTKTLLQEIEYIPAQVSLHTDAESTINDGFQNASDRVLYYVGTNRNGASHVSGAIGRIFGMKDSNLILTVHDEKLVLDDKKVKLRKHWWHHPFTIWELLVTQLLIPLVNSKRGLHLAGDWTRGVGHNDAIVAGTVAACAAGVSHRPASGARNYLYAELLRSVCNHNSKDLDPEISDVKKEDVKKEPGLFRERASSPHKLVRLQSASLIVDSVAGFQ
mmetsp:Transcript_161379/g.286165  ORF Transcript_161379/g.286165 Transcript_161379/m.286165 type:complete len:619 (+) Transcript_161379:110-1966(+)